MKLLTTIIVLAGALSSSPARADQFDGIKKRIAEADCVSFEFLSVLSSSVFDTRDSSRGTAQIARDGRYVIVLGNDVYLCNGKSAYTYSPSTNQVIVEPLDSGRVASKEISFLTRLDEYYETRCIEANQKYRLTKKVDVSAGNIPDSMLVIIDTGRQQIDHIDYLDVNDEQVRVVLTEQKLDLECNDSVFVPAFPDSAETVKL
jgi:outer membrane lipoprotein-sorting protein